MAITHKPTAYIVECTLSIHFLTLDCQRSLDRASKAIKYRHVAVKEATLGQASAYVIE